MSTRLYVGNLSYNTTENQLQDLFAQHGPVSKVDLIMDKFSGRPRGFAFVTMEDGADAAIQALHGQNVDGRDLTVNEARPREENAPRSGGGGGGGGGYRGGNRGGGGGGRSDRSDRAPRREYSR